jgi:hypothetical protein
VLGSTSLAVTLRFKCLPSLSKIRSHLAEHHDGEHVFEVFLVERQRHFLYLMAQCLKEYSGVFYGLNALRINGMPEGVGGRKTDAERARVLLQFLQEGARGRCGDVRFTGRRTAKDIEENGGCRAPSD